MLFICVAPHIKSKGFPIGGLLLSKNIILFTRIASRTKSKGAPDRRSLTQQFFFIFFTRVAPCIKSKGLPLGGPLLNKKIILFTCVAPCTKSKGLPIGGLLLSKKFILFICVAPCTKSKGLPIGGLLLSKKFILFTRVSSRIKSKGALDRCFTHLLLLPARTSPRTKSKWHHRFVLQIYYFINQVHGPEILAPGTSEVLVITNTPKKHPEEANQMLDLIGSSMRSHEDEGNNGVIDPDQWFKILLVYSCYQYTRSSSSMQKQKITKPWGCCCHRTLQD
jgi:hypothetical protein